MNDLKKQEKLGELLRLDADEKNARQKRRYHVVLLRLKGYSSREISELLHMPLRTVNAHIAAYKKGGAEALAIKKRPGVKKKLTDEQEKELYRTISAHTPEEMGMGPFGIWSAALACAYVERRFKVTFTEGGMLSLLRRIKKDHTEPDDPPDKAGEER